VFEDAAAFERGPPAYSIIERGHIARQRSAAYNFGGNTLPGEIPGISNPYGHGCGASRRSAVTTSGKTESPTKD
jgi:hypothetical protein